ncbi:MAG: T9SS type A sorting domain-containing protein [Flavobacteriales bacterium]|nr:T9SS type A sorting domain-containing protein [Flavobacteriales bacterium]
MLYPVPSDGSGFHLLFDAVEGTEGQALLSVIDMAGREVATAGFTVAEGEVRHEVEFTNALTTGMYLVRVNVNGAMLHSRLVVR